ncbi:MAG: HAD-IA family hydrolase [Bacteroidaceae bacterium]|nr:HAD-IA family hydrolase [Bacteroidaceae bacterium]
MSLTNKYELTHPLSPSLKERGSGGESFRAVFFDMDGVLFDSMPGHAFAWAKVMTEYGLPMKEVDAFVNEGRTGIGTISIFTQRYWGRDATEEEARELYRRKTIVFNEYMASRGGEAPEIPGAGAVLNKVRACGMKRVLVTGSAQQSLLTRLEQHYPGHFTADLMVTGDDVRYGKPNPEPYLMALKKAGVTANEALVVENAPLGVRAAVAAGIPTIAVNTGPLPNHLLMDEGATWLFPSMQTLADVWDILFAPASGQQNK